MTKVEFIIFYIVLMSGISGGIIYYCVIHKTRNDKNTNVVQQSSCVERNNVQTK